MEVLLSELKTKELVNTLDGKKLGRIIDLLFDNSTGMIKGIIVPGEKKIFRKPEDIFIPLDKIKRIGDDVILVSLSNPRNLSFQNASYPYYSTDVLKSNSSVKYFIGQSQSNNDSYIRYRKLDNKKYK